MRRSKLFQMISITMTVTAVMLILKSGLIERTVDELRNLAITREKIVEVCTDAIDGTGLDYTTYFQNYSDKLQGYFTPEETSEGSTLLLDYIKGGSSDTTKITDYAWKRAAPYVVFIAFAVICLIGWVFYWICCCCPCCCCKKSESEGCCRFLSFLLVLCSYVGIVVACIIGFIYSGQFVTKFSSTSCALLKFYEEAVYGESTTVLPKWVGIEGIKDLLDGTSAAVDQINANSATAFAGNEWIDTMPADFKTSLEDAFTTYGTSTLPNRNPAASKSNGVTTLQPTYIKTYGDYETSLTALNSIFQEFDTKIQASIAIINNAEEYSDQIATYTTDIKDTLNEMKSGVEDMNTALQSASSSIMQTWVDIQDQVNQNGVKAFLALFSLVIGLAVCGAVFIMMYSFCCANKCLKILLIIIWNLLTLIMILTFLLGGLFGVFGLAINDGVPVIQWIFSEENLMSSDPKVLTDPNANKRLNICLNGDGDLSKDFVTADSNANYLDRLYQISFQLDEMKAMFVANKNSEAVKKLDETYNGIIADITQSTDTSHGNNDISTVLTEWRGWTDSSQAKYQKGCTPASQDVWVQNQNKCPSGYTYNTNGGNLGDKNCISFVAFTGDISTRYSTLTGCQASGSTDFTSVSDAADQYSTAMKNYRTDNSALLNNLILKNADFNTDFVAMANNLITTFDKVKTVTQPLEDLLLDVVGQNRMFDLINCGFIKENMNNFYNELSTNMGPSATQLGGVIIAVSFLEAVSVFFIIMVINKYAADEAKDSNEAVPKS